MLFLIKSKNNNAISNGLKISGGLGYATDNKASISFTKFWGATLGYKNTLNFEKESKPYVLK